MASNSFDGIRILQVPHIYLPRIGGIQFHVLNLSKYLLEQNHSVEILSTMDGVRGTQRPIFGVKTTLVPTFPIIGKNPLSPALFFKQLGMANTFDILHAHGTQMASTFYSSVVRKCIAKKPLVITSHGYASPEYLSGTMRALLGMANASARFSLKRADAIIALTHHERSLLLKTAGVEIEERVHVLPNATGLSKSDVNRYDPSRSKKGLGLDRHFVILFVGDLGRRKGVRYLIESMNHLSDKDAFLVVVGIGNQEELDIPSRLTKRIRFAGNIDRNTLLQYYAASDVVVLPSLKEGFPTIILEAWMFSKPVILSDIPTHREIVRDFKGGLLVKAGSDGELANTIQYIIDNPKIRRRLGKVGNKAALTHFTWPIVGSKILKLYEKILSR